MSRAATALSLALVASLSATLGGCGDAPEPAKTPAQVKQEQAAARERAKQGPIGDQIRAIDKAKGVQDTVDQQADALRKQAEAPAAAADSAATAPPPP